jgi:hypothetical protein
LEFNATRQLDAIPPVANDVRNICPVSTVPIVSVVCKVLITIITICHDLCDEELKAVADVRYRDGLFVKTLKQRLALRRAIHVVRMGYEFGNLRAIGVGETIKRVEERVER